MCLCDRCKRGLPHYTREEKRAREATFPKCACGATLGLQRVKDGISLCGPCTERAEYKSPTDKLQEQMLKLAYRVADLEARLNSARITFDN